jgi:hypothetical protein
MVVPCLEGNDKPKVQVCTYKLGEYMGIILTSEKGGPDVVAMSLLCATAKLEEAGKCLLADQVAMSITGTTTSEKDGTILKYLLDGMPLSHETTVTTENRQYTMQTVGISFYIYASNSWKAQ